MKHNLILTITSMLILSACSHPPKPVYDPRAHIIDPVTGHTTRDILVARLECELLMKEHVEQIMFGNVNNWDGMRVFVKCMTDRGWAVVNEDAFR